MVFFSIIIPAYNAGIYIKRCLDSIFSQTFHDFEVIVVNNYSTDDTEAILKSYSDKRLRYYNENNNGIIAHSRNYGISKAKGNWICFLDADDWFRNDKLEKTYELIAHTDADIVYHPLSVMSSMGERKKLGKPLTWQNKYLELLIDGNKICNSSVSVKKTVLDDIGYISECPDLVGVEDFDYWLRIVKGEYHIEYIPDALGYYWEGDNLSASVKQIDRIDSLYEKHMPNVSLDKKRRVLYAKKYRQARILHGIGEFNKAKTLYMTLLKCNISCNEWPKILVLFLLSLLNIKK